MIFNLKLMFRKNKTEKPVETITEEKELSDVVTEDTTKVIEESAEETIEETEVPEEKEKVESFDEDTLFVSFFKTSEDSEWQLFPKISSTSLQAENRIKTQVSTHDIHVVPVNLP